MDGDGFDADALGHLGNLDRDNIIFIPAGTNFDGKRNFYRGADGAEKFFEMHEVAQQAGAATFDHFFYRATEIDIDLIEAEVFGERGGRGHDGGIGAENLGRDGMLVGVEIQIVQSARGIAGEAFGAGEFGHDQAAGTEGTDHAAEDGVGDAGHGGEDGGGLDDGVANFEFSGKHDLA